MKKFTLWAFLCISFVLYGQLSYAQTDVLTQHNDLNRTGWDNTETILNQSNVTPSTFGLLYQQSVDDQIYAQPLVVSGVTIGGVQKNVVYVATVNNTVYAFDADNGPSDPFWKRNFTPTGEMVPNAGDVHANLCNFTYTDFQGVNALGQQGSYGIVGTPVIDKSTNTIYFVSRYRDMTVDNAVQGSPGHNNDPDWSSAGFFQELHALDLSTGADKFGSPVLIDSATTYVAGVGPGSVGGLVYFDPRRENQRGGLVLSNGIVYIPYAGHCDMDNYHGWVLGYKASDITQQLIRYVTTPNDGRGGIWMSGAAPAVDAAGNLYFASGNANDASLPTDENNVGLSVVKASPDITNHILDNISWFKPTSYTSFNSGDLDFGTGVVLIPGTNMLVTAHKSGYLMLMNQNIPSPGGEYNENSSNFLGSYNLGGNGVQSHSSLAYFGGAATQYVYQFSEYTPLKAYPVGVNSLGTPILSNIPTNVGICGGFMSVSSNGTDSNSAILWVTHATGNGNANSGTVPGTLHALKANNVAVELWNSNDVAEDNLGNFAKMTCVTVANGKVYAPTFSNMLDVYGLIAGNSRCVNNVALGKTDTASSNDGMNWASNAIDGNTDTRWAVGWPNGSLDISPSLIVDLGQRYNICKVSIQWNNVNGVYSDYAINFTIDVSDDSTHWTTVNTLTGNSFTGNPAINEFNENTTGRYVRMHATQGGAAGTSIREMQVYGSPASNCAPPAAGSLTVTHITQDSATLGWDAVPGVSDYIVKYKGSTVSSYITRTVHDTSTSTVSLKIGALTCGFNYQFQVASDCGGAGISDSSTQSFQMLDCTSPCSNLTRFNHGDLGDIQVPGMSCYSDPVFTVTGAGTGLGGNGDQFQFNYAGLSNDEEFIMRVLSQDDVAPLNQNQAGIMMRDSLTDISRYVFIGKTGDNNLLFIYRSTPGGMAVTDSMPNSTNANFFRIVKAGTQYGVFFGNSVSGPWTQMGATQDLGFGTQPLYIGMAVSSLNPTVTSTATFDNLTENSSTLPVQLVNFTATNVQNQYVSLKWQTTMEENSDYFDVERSTDGVNFAKITTVKAAGYSSTLQSYTAVDNNPQNGINFYRLKEVDLDSRFSYSPFQSVKFGVGTDPVIYPNPVSTSFTAVAGSDPILEMVIYDLQGKAVQYVMGNSNGDDMKVIVSNLASGIYILKIKTISKDYQMKIVKE